MEDYDIPFRTIFISKEPFCSERFQTYSTDLSWQATFPAPSKDDFISISEIVPPRKDITADDAGERNAVGVGDDKSALSLFELNPISVEMTRVRRALYSL